MVQERGNIFVKASVPGVNPEDIDVSMLYDYRILSP
jgi:HSP20 family molecular chaperone IbpA